MYLFAYMYVNQALFVKFIVDFIYNKNNVNYQQQ